ncbi:MAG: UDP-3-O-(3-hydroxymyristoyl)glucosamine N-acyltransferase [Bacteroidota bacterium]|jgi:UDP-3-O-[3-hydroxymyristoyl] glucosamine N-acyltransferase|nr:UDP-3-O-(3-hydroxymyristoyl)glucosamine N-acyltransferase [Chitinophagaceae bacterium]MCE2758424.1 UDP-3-O-(3-hydroxymyristoyl)glucosamine N-acyltransferase [Chitinophagaceae bacterium]GDX43695.1 UDP-3-O-acylglucosamine N-acyltransferase [Bacteroidota bacterium]
MKFTALQIATHISGTIEGDETTSVNGFSKIEEGKEGDISFLANPKYEDHLYATKASIVVVSNVLELRQTVKPTLIRVSDPYASFAKLMRYYQNLLSTNLVGIEQPSFVHPSAQIGKNVYIAAFTYVGENVVIGDNVKLYPHTFLGNGVTVGDNTTIFAGVKIYHLCSIGNHVLIHAGTVIGSDGFGFAPQSDGIYKKVPQLGNVTVEDYVEIGANVCIDRATMGSTTIKMGTKLDNLVQIAHNVEVGQNTVVAAQAGISGSTKIGNHVTIGGQAGIVGHIQIADGAKINGQSGISKSIREKDTTVTGSPAFEFSSAMRSQAIFRRLPDLDKKIKELENLVEIMLKEKEELSS